jgi:hypothetical protein
MTHTRRAQVLMDPAEYDRLEQIAARMGVSVAELFRCAVRAQYLGRTDEKVAAVAAITAMDLPSGPWSELKQELEDEVVRGLP